MDRTTTIVRLKNYKTGDILHCEMNELYGYFMEAKDATKHWFKTGFNKGLVFLLRVILFISMNSPILFIRFFNLFRKKSNKVKISKNDLHYSRWENLV